MFNNKEVEVDTPIEECNKFTEKYNRFESVPKWQKNIVDRSPDFVKIHSDELIPLKDFMEEPGSIKHFKTQRRSHNIFVLPFIQSI